MRIVLFIAVARKRSDLGLGCCETLYQVDSGADDLAETGTDAVPEQEDVLAVLVRGVGRVGEVLRALDGRVQDGAHTLAASRRRQRQVRHLDGVVELLDGAVGRQQRVPVLLLGALVGVVRRAAARAVGQAPFDAVAPAADAAVAGSVDVGVVVEDAVAHHVVDEVDGAPHVAEHGVAVFARRHALGMSQTRLTAATTTKTHNSFALLRDIAALVVISHLYREEINHPKETTQVISISWIRLTRQLIYAPCRSYRLIVPYVSLFGYVYCSNTFALVKKERNALKKTIDFLLYFLLRSHPLNSY